MIKIYDSLYFTSDIFSQNILAVFGTKQLSFSKNDQKIFLTIKEKFPFIKGISMLKQNHSNKVMVVEDFRKEDLVFVGEGDGMVSKLSNVALAVFTGDCLPVVLSDGENIGIYHAGWRGSLENIAERAIEKMKQLGSKIYKIKAALGPSIGACCYFIKPERAELFLQKYPEWKEKILQKSQGKIFLNIPLLNYLQFVKAGVQKENIDFFPFCTSCDNRFYSLRRDKRLERQMISFILKRK